MKTELVAITFPNENGAEGLLKTLERLMQEHLIESKNATIVSKDFQGNLRVQRSAPISQNSGKCCELGFIVGLLLRGAIADELLGEASGTFFVHQVDLGIPQEKIELMTHDMVAGGSVLFLRDCSSLNGTFEHICAQANGKLHYLPLPGQTATEVNIMVSTLNHYWN